MQGDFSRLRKGLSTTEITYRVTVDGEPVRFGHNYSSASRAAAWKSYEIWATDPNAEVAIDELHNGEYFHTLRNSERERFDPENIYSLPSMVQSVAEDRALRS